MTPIVNFLPTASILRLNSKSLNIWQSLHRRRQLSIIIFTIIINIRPYRPTAGMAYWAGSWGHYTVQAVLGDWGTGDQGPGAPFAETAIWAPCGDWDPGARTAGAPIAACQQCPAGTRTRPATWYFF